MNTEELNKIRQIALQRFLVEYGLRKKLVEVDTSEQQFKLSPEETEEARKECARHVRRYDPNIAVGQVRMLSGTERPTYVLAARRWNNMSWLVLPFSDYSVPATETELKLRIDGGVGLRVLQLWNSRSLLDETLGKSWIAHTLPDDEVEDALTAWEWSVGVGSLSEDQMARTGLPIMRRDDPRIEYENCEIANFAKVDAEDMSAVELRERQAFVHDALKGIKSHPFALSSVFRQDYALAAAEIAKPVSADCIIPGFNVVVHVRYNPVDRHLQLRVFDASGERSSALDGWSVFGSDAKLFGVVSGADFAHIFESPFDGVLAVADSEGNVIPLVSDK